MIDGEILWRSENCKLYFFKFGRLYTNTGVFVNELRSEAFMIDAPYGSFQALQNSVLKDIKIKTLLITHAHWDHIGDDYLFQQAGTKVYVHHNGREIVESPSVLIPYTGSSYGLHPCPVDGEIVDGEHMTIAGTDVIMRWVPGHSASGMCFYIKRTGVVFVGDTLFRESIGRYDFLDSDKDQLIASIKNNILSLPEDTVIVPGHGELTTVGYEVRNNPFL